MSQELKPCPGVGSPDPLVATDGYGFKEHILSFHQGDLTGLGHWVECACGWAGPMCSTEEQAAERWNRRVAPQAQGVGKVWKPTDDGKCGVCQKPQIHENHHAYGAQVRNFHPFVPSVPGPIQEKKQ